MDDIGLISRFCFLSLKSCGLQFVHTVLCCWGRVGWCGVCAVFVSEDACLTG